MLEEMVSQAVNNSDLGIHTMNIYRHFKGGYYIVQSIATVEADRNGEQVVIYQSLQDGRVWTRPVSSFVEPVPEDKPNPTGQKLRFERVTKFNNQLNLIPTEELVKELLSRDDCPVELQTSLSDKVWREEYLVGRYDMVYVDRNNSHEDFFLTNIFDSLDRAISYARNHPNTEILKRVYIKQDFD